jgi:hypothetical protein
MDRNSNMIERQPQTMSNMTRVCHSLSAEQGSGRCIEIGWLSEERLEKLLDVGRGRMGTAFSSNTGIPSQYRPFNSVGPPFEKPIQEDQRFELES